MTREEIAAQAEQEKKQRAEMCMKELQAVLEKHQCELVAVPQFAPNSGEWRVVAVVQLIAK